MLALAVSLALLPLACALVLLLPGLLGSRHLRGEHFEEGGAFFACVRQRRLECALPVLLGLGRVGFPWPPVPLRTATAGATEVDVRPVAGFEVRGGGGRV